MKAIILNSGIGSRLHKYTLNNPKALVAISNTETIFSRQIRLLLKNGLSDILVTTGYCNGMIQNYASTNFPDVKIQYCLNERFRTTNYITSLDLLYNLIQDDIILMHGDLVFDDSILHDMLKVDDSIVVVDNSLPLPNKDFKARVISGKVKAIDVNISGENCISCQPLYKLKQLDWNKWQAAIHQFCENGYEGEYAEAALNSITNSIFLKPFNINGKLCKEIDNENDLQIVRNILSDKYLLYK